MTSIIGHDPGVTGGFVHIVNGSITGFAPVTRVNDRVDAVGAYIWMQRMCGESSTLPIFVCEKVGPMPHDTPRTAWSFGSAEAVMVACAQMLGMKIHFASPHDWQKAILQGRAISTRKSRIESAFSFALENYPALSDVLKLAKNDGIASAACIGTFGARLHKRGRI